jgi:hypothetical protein
LWQSFSPKASVFIKNFFNIFTNFQTDFLSLFGRYFSRKRDVFLWVQDGESKKAVSVHNNRLTATIFYDTSLHGVINCCNDYI